MKGDFLQFQRKGLCDHSVTERWKPQGDRSHPEAPDVGGAQARTRDPKSSELWAGTLGQGAHRRGSAGRNPRPGAHRPGQRGPEPRPARGLTTSAAAPACPPRPGPSPAPPVLTHAQLHHVRVVGPDDHEGEEEHRNPAHHALAAAPECPGRHVPPVTPCARFPRFCRAPRPRAFFRQLPLPRGTAAPSRGVGRRRNSAPRGGQAGPAPAPRPAAPPLAWAPGAPRRGWGFPAEGGGARGWVGLFSGPPTGFGEGSGWKRGDRAKGVGDHPGPGDESGGDAPGEKNESLATLGTSEIRQVGVLFYIRPCSLQCASERVLYTLK